MHLFNQDEYDEDTDLILFGDDGGYVNVIYVHRKFFVEASSEDKTHELTPTKLMKKDSFEMYNISLYKRLVHPDWVLKVQFYPEINAFISCSRSGQISLIVLSFEKDG